MAAQNTGPTFGGGAPAPSQATSAANNKYFISPSTGNMVTWDETGKQTDTGQKPGLQQNLDAGYGASAPVDMENPNAGPNRGTGSVWNHISDMPTDTYQSYRTKMDAMKGNEMGAWLQGGSAPLSEEEWNAQQERAKAGPTSFGGGSASPAASSTGTATPQSVGTSGTSGASSGGILAGGSSSQSTATGAPGTWNVTDDQTVESRIAGILNPSSAMSPIIQQARTRALEQKNERGLANSSLAQTASDSAAYDAALQIAKPDAATFADAGKTNALAKTQWEISQANNQTSRDNTTANIAAQRELQRSTQLYNNLSTQTATATSIQQWGMTTITAIQASDLSADAKNAAISSVKQFLTDSYQIQGDWHTSAARAIDAIFD